MTLTLPVLDTATQVRPAPACECTSGGYCHGGSDPGRCGEPTPVTARCPAAATWTVRVQFECGMFHAHDDIVNLCTHCLTDLRRAEDDDGTATILWTLPISGSGC